ncbi:hypothetical protein POM88_037695 [Heracleum sosnowskyi]|uniref:RNase H type-1 domain-containing protein n=1 Tax=Heracleum sosnowskyi TaxID=360622 RepID=A0AAD8HRL5_9APIA|nr:hypothetical protein POM88_037695 [Heracleum sosnowskyi]
MPNLNVDPNLRVADLIDFENGSWNVDIVRGVFSDDDIGSILSHWLAKLGHHSPWLLTNGSNAEHLWKRLWSLNVPPKLQHFIWRACKGSLSVKERLNNRHIITDSVCQVCGDEGVVIRDVHGHIIAEAVQKLQVKWKAEQAEVAAVRFGLHLARRLGIMNTELKCDALNVVRSINSGIEGYSPVTLLYEDIARMKSEFMFFRCRRVSRADNTLPHLI